MTPYEVMKRYGGELYRSVETMCQRVSDLQHEGIEAILETMGIEFDWRHSSQPFEDFVAHLDCTDQVRAMLLRRWTIAQDVKSEMSEVFECWERERNRKPLPGVCIHCQRTV